MTWCAPPPPWTFGATDLEEQLLPEGDRLLLIWLWTTADAPSKRSPGHQEIYRGIAIKTLAERLGCSRRAIEDRLKRLRDARLVERRRVDDKRGEVLVLADLEGVGRLETTADRGRSGRRDASETTADRGPPPRRTVVLDRDPLARVAALGRGPRAAFLTAAQRHSSRC